MTFCGVCCEVYAVITDEPEIWIQCDSCLKWFHFECADIDPKSVPEQLFIYTVLAMLFCIYVLMKIFICFSLSPIEIFFQHLYIPGQMPFLSPTLLGRGKEGHSTN